MLRILLTLLITILNYPSAFSVVIYSALSASSLRYNHEVRNITIHTLAAGLLLPLNESWCLLRYWYLRYLQIFLWIKRGHRSGWKNKCSLCVWKGSIQQSLSPRKLETTRCPPLHWQRTKVLIKTPDFGLL